MGKNRTKRYSNHETMKEVEMDWPCLEKGRDITSPEWP